jgi:hypothetical protein
MKNKLFALFFLCLLLKVSYGQTVDEIRKQFPGEKAVMLNRTREYNISLKDGAPVVESRELEQTEYLLGSATAYMGNGGFSSSDFQQLVSYEAYTRTSDGKKLKVSDFNTSTDKESFVFYDDVKETSFHFPSVEPGAIGNLEVSWHNKDPHLLSPYYFSAYMPSLKSELKVTVSKDITLRYHLMGLDTNAINVKIDNHSRNKTYTFSYQNCPGDKRYPDAPDFAWYSPHVIFYIADYKDENGKSIPYLSNTDDLFRLNYSFIKSVNTAVSPVLKHVVDSLTRNAASEEDKARNIYSWVQHHIKYVAFEDGMGGFVPRDAGLVCNRRFGDCKDMASILTEMLNVAGVPAYFTWIGTRDLPYSYSQVPLPLASNHMICTTRINGKYIFLDATDPTCIFGMPSAGIQDKEAMIALNDKEYKIIKVPVIEKSRNTLNDTTWMELSPDGIIKGKVRQKMEGYLAMNMYGKLLYWKNKDMDENMKAEFERGSNKFHLDSFRVESSDAAKGISLTGSFNLPDYAKKIGNEYYLNLNLFKFYENEQIDYPRRKMPVEYNFLFQKKYVIIFNIPQGFKLSYLPESKSYHNNVWGFDLKYEQKNNQVILTQQFDNDHLILNSDQFESWNKVLENLLPLYKKTLSLTKI